MIHRINKTPSFARGLAFAAYFDGFAKSAGINPSGQVPITFTGSSGTTGIAQTGTEVITFNRPPRLNTTMGTCLFSFRGNGTAPQNNAKLFITTDVELQIFRSSSGDAFQFVSIENTNVEYNLADIWDGEWHIIAAKWDNGSPSRNYFVDGTWGTADSTSWTPTGGTSDLSLLNRDDGARQSEGEMGYCFLWDRYLSDVEVISLYKDITQLRGGPTFRPYLWSIPTGAPPAGRIMSSLVHHGGLAAKGGIAGIGGGLAG